MILTKKVRIRPALEQEQQLWRSVGTARWVYNWTLSRQEENHKHGVKFLSDGDLRKELTQLKHTEEYAWLCNVSNNVAKQAVKDACDALRRCLRDLQRNQSSSPERNQGHLFTMTQLNLRLKIKLSC